MNAIMSSKEMESLGREFVEHAAARYKNVPLQFPRCQNCERIDCPLLATVIIGVLNYVRAIVDCYRTRQAGQRVQHVSAKDAYWHDNPWGRR